MSRRRRLGQHFLRSPEVARLVVGAARLTRADTVLEVGTGRGALTGLLAERAGRVVSVEADRGLYEAAAARLSAPNLELRHGDGLREGGGYTAFVSSLPYSRSRDAVAWLAQSGVRRASLLVQKEFADKLAAPPRERRAVAVVAGHCFRVERVADVGPGCFDPPPAVGSAVVALERRARLPPRTVAAVGRIFSYRRKTVGNIMAQFGVSSGSRRRLEELGAGEIVGLAERIA